MWILCPAEDSLETSSLYFLWKPMKKYLWMLSAAFATGALRVQRDSYLQWFVAHCPIYHWMGVSRELDISQAWLTNNQWYISGNKSLVSKTILILTQKKWQKGKSILQMFPVFCHYIKENPTKNFDCNRGVNMNSLSFWCDKTMLHCLASWRWKLTSPNKSKWHRASLCSDLSCNKLLDFSVCYIGDRY